MPFIPELPSPKSDWSAWAQCDSSGRTPRASGPKVSNAVCVQHVTAKVQSCKAVLSRQSRCTDGLEAPRLEIFVQGAPQRRARHVHRAAPTGRAQSLPRRLVHGRFDLGQSLTRSPPLQRTRSRRTCSRGCRPSSSHVLHCPVTATTRDAKFQNVRDQKKNQKLLEQSSSSTTSSS